MTNKFTRVASLIVCSLGACAEVPADEGPRLEPEAQVAVDDAVEPLLLADISLPTRDARAHYTFQFVRGAADEIATLIDAPLGYPMPVMAADECALDTFLRVAPADARVPAELLRACGRAEVLELASDGRTTTKVAELNTEGLTLEFEPVAAVQSVCSESVLNARAEELRRLAEYQPPIPQVQFNCTLWRLWDQNGCSFLDRNGNTLRDCNRSEYLQALAEGNNGLKCMNNESEVSFIPNPACAHNEFVIADLNHRRSWDRYSTSGRVSHLRAEVTNCSSAAIPATWQARPEGQDWGGLQLVGVPAMSRKSILLQAGSSDGRWRGWDFRVRASAPNTPFHAISAWVELEGRDRDACPSLLW